MNSSSATKQYPLGSVENLMRQIYDHFDGEGASAFVFRIKGDMDERLLRQSLLIVQNRHPRLRCRFALNESGMPFFELVESCPRIPLNIIESDVNDLNWQEVVNKVLYPPMDTRIGPLMRVCLLKHTQHDLCDFIWGAHHAIIDGRSMFILTHDLLSTYQSLKENRTIKIINSLPMIMGNKIDISLNPVARVRTLLSLYRYIPQFRLKRCVRLPKHSGCNSPLWQRIILPDNETKMLKLKCRNNHTTVTGAMFASAVLALGHLLKGKSHRFACRCPVSLIGPDGYQFGVENIGCFVSTIVNMYTVSSNTLFWDFARKVIKDIRSDIESKIPIMAFNMSHVIKFRPDKIPDRDHLSIDNLGIIQKTQYGPLKIVEYSPVSRRKYFGVSIMIVFCSVNGCLNITLDAADIPPDLFYGYQKELMRVLKTHIDG